MIDPGSSQTDLLLSESLRAAAFEAVADPVVVTDPLGRICWVNSAFTTQNGWTRDEVVGRKPSILKSGATPPEVYETLWREILAGRVWNGEVTNRRKDGTEYVALLTIAPVRAHGDGVSHFVATHRDITRLRSAEASFRALLDNLPDAVVVHRNGRFVYANAQAASLLGYTRAWELIGRSVLDVIHPDDRAKVAARMNSGTAARPLEERLLRRDGGIVFGEVTGLPLSFDGQPAVVASCRDLSERKELTARMMQLDRAIAIGTLAAGVAHEINNPLAYVAANLEHVARALDGPVGEPDAAELREALAEARSGAERIRRIVRDLKSVSRAQDDAREPVDPLPVLEASINLSWNEIRQRARLEKDFGPVPRVLANEGRLGQVFVNLLVNAAQAIPEGAAERNRIRVVTRTDVAGRAVIEVHDTGTGIAPEVLPRIFDAFFTTKPVGQGTGLGLGICQQIVRDLGGETGVESAPGAGAVFRVTLPADPEFREAAPARAEDVRAPRRRGRVLIVDDEPLIGRALGRSLAGSHDVVAVTRAADAVERIARGERFDAILCDLMMPETSGMDLHAELLRNHPDLAERMVFITGGAFTPAAQDFLERVRNPRLDKPVDSGALEAILRGLIDR